MNWRQALCCPLSVSTEDAVTYYPPPPPPPPGYGPYQPAPQWQPPPDPLISPDYSGWFSRGVAIAGRGWKQLAGLQLMGLVVVVALGAPFALYLVRTQSQLQRDFQTPTATTQTPDLGPLFTLFGLELIAIPVLLIVTSTVTLASVHISVSVAMGLPARITDALSLAARRVFPLIGWQLLALPIYLLGLCVCVLPVFYVAAVFAVLPAVVAVERTNVISRCFTLFNRNVGLAVARIATIVGLGVAAGIVGSIGGLVARAVTGSSLTGTSTSVTGTVTSALISAVVAAGIAVLTAPLIVAAYADMRSRIEPTNATLIAQQLGILQAPPPPPPQQGWPYGVPSI
jgi:hypothetical protein